MSNAAESDPATDPRPARPVHSSSTPAWTRGRKLLILIAALGLIGCALAIWRFQRQPESPPVPPIPPGIVEPEIIAVLEKKRAEVLANPRLANLWGEYAMLLLAHLFDREAEFCLAEASRLDPGDPRWWYTRGHIALKKDPASAPGLLKQAIDTTGPGEEYRSAARFHLAEWYLEQGQLDEAENLFAREMGPAPGNPRAVLGLGMVALARQDNARATQLLESLLGNENAKKRANVCLAQLARARGDINKAEQYERVAARLPEAFSWPDPMYDVIPMLAVGRRGRDRMITFLEQSHKFNEALSAYQAELEIERTPQALIGAGVNCVRLGMFDKAIEYMREAYRLDPSSPVSTYNLSQVLFTRGVNEIVRNPASSDARKWFQEAIEFARKTTELKKDHAKAFLLWGLSLLHLGDARAAVKPLQEGINAKPDTFELHMAMGEVQAQLGNTTEAEKYFQNAEKLDPFEPRPRQELEKLKGKKP